MYQFFIVFTATQSGGISLIILFQLVNTLVYMWLQIRNNHKLFRYFTHCSIILLRSPLTSSLPTSMKLWQYLHKQTFEDLSSQARSRERGNWVNIIKWYSPIVVSNIITYNNGGIHLQYMRVAVTFLHWNFVLFSSS